MEWHADLDRNSWIEIEFGFEIQIEIAFAVARKHRKGVESNDLHFATTKLVQKLLFKKYFRMIVPKVLRILVVTK